MCHEKIKNSEKSAKDSSKKVIDSYDEWKKNYPARTKEALMEHGKSILQPVGHYYKSQFLEKTGDCFKMREMSEACQMFDPLFLCKMSTADVVTVLHALAEKLAVIGFRQFDESFIDKLCKEQAKVVKEAKRDHDLDRIPASRQYQTRLQKRIRRKKLPTHGTEVDWKKDAGECA